MNKEISKLITDYNKANQSIKKEFNDKIVKPSIVYLNKKGFKKENICTWYKRQGEFMIYACIPVDISSKFEFNLQIYCDDNVETEILDKTFDSLKDFKEFYDSYKLPEMQSFMIQIPIKGLSKEHAIQEFEHNYRYDLNSIDDIMIVTPLSL